MIGKAEAHAAMLRPKQQERSCRLCAGNANGRRFPCDGLSQQEDIALLQALSGLTARERFILFERVLNDRGYDELAEALGLRYNGVASAYHRTIKKLRKNLRGGVK